MGPRGVPPAPAIGLLPAGNLTLSELLTMSEAKRFVRYGGLRLGGPAGSPRTTQMLDRSPHSRTPVLAPPVSGVLARNGGRELCERVDMARRDLGGLADHLAGAIPV